MAGERVAIVGAGIGGLSAAVLLAAKGCAVTVLERAATPGGKMREVGPARIDAGPTVFTMRWVFDEIFASAGTSLGSHVTLVPASILARHAWDHGESGGGGRLDLFADTARTADAVGDFAGAAEARGFLAFCEETRRIYETLETSFIRGARPTPFSLVRDAGLSGLGGLLAIKPFETMWAALGKHFADPRLRQLFGRYATYCGSSPFLAPATLMLVAHVEREGVWLVQGGMRRLADALASVAASHGAAIRYGAQVEEVLTASGRVTGLRLADGERIAAEVVVLNTDAASLAAGLFGWPAAHSTPPVRPEDRSLSAITWAEIATAEGFPLVRHNVFFSADYAAEFRDLREGRVPRAPTLYVCAQDRDDSGLPAPGPERLLLLVNAPANGDTRDYPSQEIETCANTALSLLERCGLHVQRNAAASVVTTPIDFSALFPATGGALYGQAVHGAMASFRRPGSRTKLPGLYLAGGSTHPGAGVPMAALSGRQAAASVLQDLVSISRSRPAATPGGMSMR